MSDHYTKTTIHWVCDLNTPYTSFLFRILALEPDIDLQVHFIRKTIASHPWQETLTEGFSSRYYQRFFGVDLTLLKMAATNKQNLFVLGSWYEPTVNLVFGLLMLRQSPFVIWTDTPNIYAKRHPLKSVLRILWLRQVFKRAEFVMGTGNPALNILESMGCPKTKLVNFPYFVDVDAYVPQTNVQRTDLNFISVGRLHTVKGYDIALQALSIIHHQYSHLSFRYRIVGDGPEAKHLQQQAVELGIGEFVQFEGWLEPEPLRKLYSQSDVFLHPARFEPYGVAVLEAMASGLIVVGSDRTIAILDRVRPSINGFVHRVDDVADLTSQIDQILKYPDRMLQLKEAARLTAEEWHISRGVHIIKSLLKTV